MNYLKIFKILCIPIALCLSLPSNAQQRPVNSLYMFDQALINPAYAGSAVQLSATAIHRNQWVNFPGAPVTTTFTVHSGFLKSKIGLGIMLARDVIGIHEDYSFYVQYSYKIKSDYGTLHMGLQAGFNNLSSDFSSLTLRNLADPNLIGRRVKFNPNFGGGFYFNNEKMYAGISAPYLINNEIVDFEGVVSEAKQRRNYYINGGLRLNVNENVLFLPSTLIRLQEGAPLSFDISGTFVFHETVGLGVSYRAIDAIVTMFELKINENFHMGYAYDQTLSDIRDFSDGTHEIMINYRIRIPKVHQGLECPSYF